MRFRSLLAALAIPLFSAPVPEGFTPIYNGRDLSGWHISEVNHHGNTRAWKPAEHGVLTVTQDKPGNGGILLTDRQYQDFEVSLEINPDFGCDGGLFLRSNEKGQAYQVMFDYLEGGNMGGIYGEKLQESGYDGSGTGKRAEPEWRKYWKKGEWNHIRARITGDVPHIQVWMNGTLIVDWTDSANHLPGGATAGMIALQAHRSTPGAKNSRWAPGGLHRYRNIAVKELKR